MSKTKITMRLTILMGETTFCLPTLGLDMDTGYDATYFGGKTDVSTSGE